MRKIVSLVAVLAISLVGIAALSSEAQAATTSSSDLSGQGAMMGTLDSVDSGTALVGTPPPPRSKLLDRIKDIFHGGGGGGQGGN